MFSAYFPSWHKNSVSSWVLTMFWQPGSQWMWHREAYCITDSYYKHSRQLINKAFWTFSIILWRATKYLSVAVVYCLHMEIILFRILGAIKVSEFNLSRGHWGFLTLRISKHKKMLTPMWNSGLETLQPEQRLVTPRNSESLSCI